MAVDSHESQNASSAVDARGHPPASPTASRRRPFFLLGVVLFLLGPVLYAVLFNLGYLQTPWYVPILATIGVFFMILSVGQRRGILRGAALVLFGLFCAAEWFILVVATRTPAYTGPAQPGRQLPTFAAALADGKTFTNKDLESGRPTVLLFFRGRW